MTTYTVYCEPVGGFVLAPPGDSIGDTAHTTGLATIGQHPMGSVAYEAFIAFDTSSVVGTITSAVLSLYTPDSHDASVTDFTVEARLFDWNPATPLSVGDWRSRAQLGALPLLASRSTVGWATDAYNELTSEAALVTNVASGSVPLVLCSSRHRAGDIATGQESVDISWHVDDAPPAKLVIEALAGGWGVGQVRMGAN